MTTERQLESSENLNSVVQSSIFEVFPGTKQIDFSPLPKGSFVAITSSPSKGLETTLNLSAHIKKIGYEPIPHIAARGIKNHKHLAEISAFLDYNNIHDLFLIAGDNKKPIGNYDSSVRLMHDLLILNQKIETLGIAGYPEEHPNISEEKLTQSLRQKVSIATEFGVDLYIHTQLCYDPQKIDEYLTKLKSMGINNKIFVGLSSPTSLAKQLQFALTCGVGDSISFLKKIGLNSTLKNVAFDPSNILINLAQRPTFLQVFGLHIFTMNNVPQSVGWQRNFIERE